MNVASFDLVEFKAMDGEQGLFAARVAAFGNVDRGGDRIIKGAFKKTIAKWQAGTKRIPVIFSHDWKVIEHFIGTVDPKSMVETDEGLVVAGRLDIEDNPKARSVWRKLKDGSLSGWSFGYEVKEERTAKDGARDLIEVDLLELGPTLVGMNPLAETLAVKEADLEVKSPPWHIVKRDDQFCVVLDEDGSTVKCHDTKAAAQKHMAALYANAASGEDMIQTASTSSNSISTTNTIAPYITEVTTTATSWTPEVEKKIGRVLSARHEEKIRRAHAELSEILALLSEPDEEEKSDEPEAEEVEETFSIRDHIDREITDLDIFLADRL